MKQMVVQGDWPFFPEEIMRNIFKWLPVKSLIRFQCVCKHWKNLFRTPSFLADRNPSLLLKQNGRCDPLHLSLIDSDMNVLELQNPPLIGSFPDVKIVGSCNGLLCVAIEETDMSIFSVFLYNSLLLWNPATRKVRQIPRTRTVELADWDCTVGFGFSAIVNDYKIVKTYAESCDVIREVEVYSLSTCLWKEIEFGSLEGVCLFGDTVIATNGSIYWYGDKLGVEGDGEDDVGVIVSFDLAIEVFTVIARPPLSDNSLSKFAVYEDRLAVLSISRIGDFPNSLHSLIELWVLEEDTGPSIERWSWTKKFSSNPCPSMLDLGTIWKNEIVCNDLGMIGVPNESGQEVKNDEQKVGLYFINISTNELKKFVIHRYGPPRDIFNHVESLVPVDNIRNEEP